MLAKALLLHWTAFSSQRFTLSALCVSLSLGLCWKSLFAKLQALNILPPSPPSRSPVQSFNSFLSTSLALESFWEADLHRLHNLQRVLRTIGQQGPWSLGVEKARGWGLTTLGRNKLGNIAGLARERASRNTQGPSRSQNCLARVNFMYQLNRAIESTLLFGQTVV